jgi:cytoskeleton protein RodZ
MSNQRELIPKLPGDILRHHRERQGLTLEQAAEQCRIKVSTLAAIERGETAGIPSVYLRGYIRNYARVLGIKPAEVEEHMIHVQGAEPAVQSVFGVQATRGRGEKWLKASSYLAASVLIAALAWQFTHEAVRFSQGESQLLPATAMSKSGGAPAGTGPESAAPAAGTHLSASIASVELLRQRSELGGRTTAEQAWDAIESRGEPAPPAAGAHHLELSASGDSWVEITGGDGLQLEQDLIRAGSTRVYDDSGPFDVVIGRASSVLLTLDGESVDLGPHSEGGVARLTLGAEPLADAGAPTAPESR